MTTEQRAVMEKREAEESGPSAAKRRKTVDSEDEYAGLVDDLLDDPPDEVERYMVIADSKLKSEDILKWWKENVRASLYAYAVF